MSYFSGPVYLCLTGFCAEPEVGKLLFRTNRLHINFRIFCISSFFTAIKVFLPDRCFSFAFFDLCLCLPPRSCIAATFLLAPPGKTSLPTIGCEQLPKKHTLIYVCENNSIYSVSSYLESARRKQSMLACHKSNPLTSKRPEAICQRRV